MSFLVIPSRKYIVILLQVKKQENFLLLEEMFGIIETDKFSLAHWPLKNFKDQNYSLDFIKFQFHP
jgi:hypothetical protein